MRQNQYGHGNRRPRRLSAGSNRTARCYTIIKPIWHCHFRSWTADLFGRTHLPRSAKVLLGPKVCDAMRVAWADIGHGTAGSIGLQSPGLAWEAPMLWLAPGSYSAGHRSAGCRKCRGVFPDLAVWAGWGWGVRGG